MEIGSAFPGTAYGSTFEVEMAIEMFSWLFGRGKKQPAEEYPISGGPGNTLETAFVIRAPIDRAGIVLEYMLLEGLFGQRGVHWELKSQTHLISGDRHYDQMCVRLADGRLRTVYFDITEQARQTIKEMRSEKIRRRKTGGS